MGLSYAPFNLWPLAIISFAGLLWLTRGVSSRRAIGLGYLFGVGLNSLTITWIGVLGWYVAVGLVLVVSGWTALLGWLTGRLQQLPLAVLWCGAAAVIVEFAAETVPFGGFAWNRLGFTAMDQPLAGYLPWIGVTGTTFVIAVAGGLLLRSLTHGARAVPVALLAGVFATGWGLSALNQATSPDPTGGVSVGIVQGDVKTFGRRDLGPILSVANNHLSETITLLATNQGVRPDFILWPESSTDRDPTKDAETRRVVELAVQLAEVPILVGTITYGPADDERQTVGIWWDPLLGPTDIYYKQNVVPFGEWIPFRDVLLPLFPTLKDTGRQSVPGHEPGTFEVPTSNGTVTIGDLICYDVAFDDTVASTIDAGAQLLVVQSNNASFSGTWQTSQQFQMTRVRALETGRAVAVATTKSFSGVIDQFGRVVTVSQEGMSASFLETVPTTVHRTLAMSVQPALTWLAAAAVAAGVLLSYRRRLPS